MAGYVSGTNGSKVGDQFCIYWTYNHYYTDVTSWNVTFPSPTSSIAFAGRRRITVLGIYCQRCERDGAGIRGMQPVVQPMFEATRGGLQQAAKWADMK
jgi:hypothetical protein